MNPLEYIPLDRHKALDEAIEIAGGVNKLASALGVAQNVVSMWRKRGTLIGTGDCAQIEMLFGIPRERMRPDDWERNWPELALPAFKMKRMKLRAALPVSTGT